MIKVKPENKPNVALLVRDFNMGGIEKVASNLSHILSNYFNIFIIVYSPTSYYQPKGEIIQLNNFKDNDYNLLTRSFRNISRIRQIKKVVKENDISLVISFGVSPNMINSLAGKSHKSILTVHSYKTGEESNRGGFHSKFIKFIIKYVYPFSDKIVGVSEMVCNDLEANFNINRKKLKAIYNPFMIEQISDLSKLPVDEEFTHDGKKILITVGRICKTKALWHLIRAFNYIKNQKGCEDIILQIVGNSHDPQDKQELITLVDKLYISENIQFIDYTDNPYNLMRNSTIYVSSSILEGFGNVIIESFTCGLPVIFPDCKAGPREILAPGTDLSNTAQKIEKSEFGILVPPCDGINRFVSPLTHNEQYLADAIKLMLENENLRSKYSKKGKQRSFDFKDKKIGEKYKDLIMELISE